MCYARLSAAPLRMDGCSGRTKPFLYQMVFAVRDLMEDAYPELRESADNVSRAVLAEETRFCNTMEIGLAKLEEDSRLLSPLGKAQVEDSLSRSLGRAVEDVNLELSPSRTAARRSSSTIPSECRSTSCRMRPRDQGIAFDQSGFDSAMAEQRERARASWKGAAKQTANPAYQQLPKSIFEGYRQTRSDGCEVLAIIHNGQGATGTQSRRFRRSDSRSHAVLCRFRRPGRRQRMVLFGRPQHRRRRRDAMLFADSGRAGASSRCQTSNS